MILKAYKLGEEIPENATFITTITEITEESDDIEYTKKTITYFIYSIPKEK